MHVVCTAQLEFDNALYAFGLGEAFRRRMESAGRVELRPAEMAALGVSKWIHFFCVCFGVLLGVFILSTADAHAGMLATPRNASMLLTGRTGLSDGLSG